MYCAASRSVTNLRPSGKFCRIEELGCSTGGTLQPAWIDVENGKRTLSHPSSHPSVNPEPPMPQDAAPNPSPDADQLEAAGPGHRGLWR
jgi:hypothetical protein